MNTSEQLAWVLAQRYRSLLCEQHPELILRDPRNGPDDAPGRYHIECHDQAACDRRTPDACHFDLIIYEDGRVAFNDFTDEDSYDGYGDIIPEVYYECADPAMLTQLDACVLGYFTQKIEQKREHRERARRSLKNYW